MRPLNRRIFLRDSALAMAGVGALPLWLQRTAHAAEPSSSRKKILVTLFQRGAADGLNIVVPHGEAQYYALRPSIGLPKAALLDLDGFFGLNPALAPLKPLWDAKNLAIVHAVGSPDPTRSHFDAQDYMESGTPGRKSTSDGWLNRALQPADKPSPVRAVSLGPALPRTIRGSNSAVAVESINSFKVRDDAAAKQFETLYGADQILGGTARATFDAVKLLQSLGENSAPGYPRGKFGESLKQIAQIIKADVGLEVAFADIGGWDHHVNEVAANPTEGQLAQRLAEFGSAIAAFHADLGPRMHDVVLVTMSEFGRTAKENGNRGTDHGHANAMFVLGSDVKGGKVYGEWPGLAPEQLYQNRDLAVTTDFRDVLGEAVYRHLGNRKLDSVFPGYSMDPTRFRGLLNS